MSDTTTNKFVALKQAAWRLGIPAAWLKTEALAGRVPALRTGRRIYFDIEDVKKVLIERTVQGNRAERGDDV